MKTLTQITSPKTVFLAWQHHISRRWFLIGRLTFDGEKYRFFYIQEARKAQEECGFKPLLSFPNFDKIYESNYLFPVFANRLMSPSRPEYKSFLERLNLTTETADFMVMLARSEGKRETDSFRIVPYPEKDESGHYHLLFFAHGLRHLPPGSIERINRLQVGEILWLSHEFQNRHDPQALMLTTEDHFVLGYCPRYLGSYIFNLLQNYSQGIEVKVERINAVSHPLQFRLFCRLSYSMSDEAEPFTQEDYQPIHSHS